MIELAQNGMADGDSNAPLPERLDRLRKYSSNFRNGILDREDLAAHPDYVRRIIDLTFNRSVPFQYVNLSVAAALYCIRVHHPEQFKYLYLLSGFVASSAQAGIPSCRWIMSFAARQVRKCEIDHGQDLLVTVEAASRWVGTSGNKSMYVFYSLVHHL